MHVEVVEGDLLDQPVDAIVNAWNRNVVPWWLLLPQGVSAAIKRRAGVEPFREVARYGPIPLGGAVVTGAGRLPHRGIIHVAGISLLWRSSERSIRDSVRNAVRAAEREGWASIALPIIGGGTGGFGEEAALAFIRDELEALDSEVRAVVVRYGHPTRRDGAAG
jgi:O-acetyl-ADP-ribose deacetylase